MGIKNYSVSGTPAGTNREIMDTCKKCHVAYKPNKSHIFCDACHTKRVAEIKQEEAEFREFVVKKRKQEIAKDKKRQTMIAIAAVVVAGAIGFYFWKNEN